VCASWVAGLEDGGTPDTLLSGPTAYLPPPSLPVAGADNPRVKLTNPSCKHHLTLCMTRPTGRSATYAQKEKAPREKKERCTPKWPVHTILQRASVKQHDATAQYMLLERGKDDVRRAPAGQEQGEY